MSSVTRTRINNAFVTDHINPYFSIGKYDGGFIFIKNYGIRVHKASFIK
jgi:hypothetical protein